MEWITTWCGWVWALMLILLLLFFLYDHFLLMIYDELNGMF